MNKIELEYRYVIPRDKLSTNLPKELRGFFNTKNYTLVLEDVLIERKNISLKSEKIGIRVRNDSDKYELTYKKFLGEENGAKKFDEHTTEIEKKDYESIKAGDLNVINLPGITEIKRKGELYILVILNNKRNVYIYEQNQTVLELVVEDLIYKNQSGTVNDSMLEIEIKSNEGLTEEIQDLANKIKILFNAEDSSEGKNSRAMKLLSIN